MNSLIFKFLTKLKISFNSSILTTFYFNQNLTYLIDQRMLRGFNLLRCKANRIKINDNRMNIGMLMVTNTCVNNSGVQSLIASRYFFSIHKSDIENKDLLQTAQNIEINEEGQQKKKPRRRRSKKQQQQLSKPNKISQDEFLQQNKTAPFYKILFSQHQYARQQDKLLRMLEENHKKSINCHNQSEGLLQKAEKSSKKSNKKSEKQKGLQKKKRQQQENEKQQKQINPLFQQQNIQIKKLDDLIVQANKQIEFPRMQQFEQKLFCVLDGKKNSQKILVPFGFRYHLYRFTKYHIYLSQFYSEDEMMKYQKKCKQTIRFYCLKKDDENNENQNTDGESKRIKYMQQFIANLLPFENAQQFADIYLQVGLQYVKILKQRLSQPNAFSQQIIPSVNSLRMILTNLKRLLLNNCDDFQVDDAKEQDYLLYRTFFNEYLDLFCTKKSRFETADKVQCAQIAKFLKIPHPEFMQFIKQFIQSALQNYSMVEFLLMLGYLVENKNTPYQYFYKQKGSWMKIIESSHDFSNKKTKCCIKLLQIFSRQRFVNCEKIYHKLLQIITNNLQAMEGKELVRTLYYYSRARYGTNPAFISNLVNKISRWLPYLEQRQFSLLVRSIGNLNYQSAELVQQLKNINYERFLCELKYGCENLGSYYQEILKQVETQSNRKNYYQGYENFNQSSSNNIQIQQNLSVAAEKIF